jgi:hypothetical protein
LYRADLVRSSQRFYPNASPHADTSACFKYLEKSAFGFVYEVLSYERTHGETQSSKSAQMNRYASAYLNDLLEYVPFYLEKEEFRRLLKEQLDDYHRFLAVSIVGFRGKEFWDYHKRRLEELGYPIRRPVLLKALVKKVLQEIVNPDVAIRKCWGQMGIRHADAARVTQARADWGTRDSTVKRARYVGQAGANETADGGRALAVEGEGGGRR